MGIKEKFKEKADKIKCFCKEHKTEIIAGSVAVGAFAIRCAVNGGKKTQSNFGFDDVPVMPDSAYGDIDEAIFTDLAPEIEDLVLAEGVDEGWIDRTYKVPFPKNGDWKNGSYDVLKNVQVFIRDAGDPED